MSETKQSIGDYRILGQLGQGGMGVVWRAEHSPTGRIVALKTVRVPATHLLQGILREIHALGRIVHPGIVRILDHGLDDGLPWYAMECLEGSSLRHFWRERRRASSADVATLASVGVPQPSLGTQPLDLETLDAASDLPPLPPLGALPLREALDLVRRLCDPLAFLHGEGIVHRDLKPENVWLHPDGRVILIDFGLSHLSDPGQSRESLQIEAGLSGTPHYMAPEQARGELLDARADLYSLGCVLYELLTGYRPFEADRTADLLLKHQRLQPRRPSALAPGIPSELDELVLSLLAKQPGDRLGSAEDVARILERLGAASPPAQGLPRPRPYLYRPRLAGREAIKGRLAEFLLQARSGLGGIQLLAGESGAGKTRLALDLAQTAIQAGFEVLTGECVEGAPAALGAFLKPLRAIAGRCREAGREATERWLGRGGRVLGLFEPALLEAPGLADYPEPEPLEGKAGRLRVLGDLAGALFGLAREKPLLLILDDLQWGDELSIGFLRFLSGSGALAGQCLAILGAYRSEEPSPPLEELLAEPGVRTLALERLTEEEIGGMVRDMLARPASARFVQFLARRSEGNPFFVAEYLRLAIEEGILGRTREGGWQLELADEAGEEPFEALRWPGSLRDLAERRLSNLSPLARRLAELLAILGREAAPELLQALSGPGAEGFLDALNELTRLRILEEAAEGRLRFTHDKLRELAYDSQAESSRRQAHRAAALVLEGRQPERRTSASLGELGRHWLRAGELEKGRPYCLEAGRLALERSAFEEALGLGRDAGPPEGSRLAVEALLGLSKLAEAEREAEALQSAATDPASLLEARLLLAKILERKGSFQEALRILEAFPPDRLAAAPRIEAWLLRGRVLVNLGQLDEAEQAYSQARELTAGVPRLLGRLSAALTGLGEIERHRGHFEGARSFFLESIGILRGLSGRAGLASCLNNLGILHASRSQYPEAFAALRESLELRQAIGDRSGIASSLNNLGGIHCDRGEFGESLAAHRESLRIRREIGDWWGIGYSLNNIGQIEFCQGHYGAALAAAEESLRIRRRIGELRGIAMSLLNVASIEFVREELRVVRESLAEAEQIGRRISNRAIVVEARCELASLEAWEGNPGLALELLEECEARARRHDFRHLLGFVLRHRARVLLDSESSASEAELLEVVELWRDVGNPFEEGLAWSFLARVRGRASLELIQKALALCPASGQLDLHLGVLENELALEPSLEAATQKARKALRLAEAHEARHPIRRLERVLAARGLGRPQ